MINYIQNPPRYILESQIIWRLPEGLHEEFLNVLCCSYDINTPLLKNSFTTLDGGNHVYGTRYVLFFYQSFFHYSEGHYVIPTKIGTHGVVDRQGAFILSSRLLRTHYLHFFWLKWFLLTRTIFCFEGVILTHWLVITVLIYVAQ